MPDRLEERLAVVEARVADHLEEWRKWMVRYDVKHEDLVEKVNDAQTAVHTGKVVITLSLWIGGVLYAVLSGLPAIFSFFSTHVKL